MKRVHAADIISFLLLLLFSYTAISKIITIQAFIKTLEALPYLKQGAVVLAWTVPLTELVIVLLLVFPNTRLQSFYTAIILLIFFTLYLGYMILYVPKLPCSCGGIINKLSWPSHLLLNLVLITLTGLAIANERKGRLTGVKGVQKIKPNESIIVSN